MLLPVHRSSTTDYTSITSVPTGVLLGRSTAGTGAGEAIAIGTGLTLAAGTLSATAGGAAGADKQVQFNDGGTALGGDVDYTWDKTTNTMTLGTTATPSTIKGGAGSAATGAALTVQGGLGGATNTGGAVNLTAGAGGATSGDGGVASVTGGAATTSGVGGQSRLLGGAGLGGNNNGGAAIITGGASVGSGTGGSVTITGGLSNAVNGTGIGGTVTLTGGAGGGTSGAGGNVSITGGVPTDGDGGTVAISGRGATGTNRNGGSVTLSSGVKTGSGTAGTINLQVNGTTKAQLDASGNFITKQAEAAQGYSLQIPTTGFTITIADNISDLILNPAGTLATGTITMPATPIDGQKIRISSSQIQTALTLSPNSGQSIKNAPTALTAGVGVGYIYNLSSTTWFRQY